MSEVPFFDLSRQYEELRDDLSSAVEEVLASQRYIGGPRVAQIEQKLAARVGVAHGIGVSSGTDALLASLMALEVGPGDEIITSPFTFFSPVESILRLGARPVFVDIDLATFNLDVRAVEAAIGPKTRGILPVHLFGQTCAMSQLMELAADRDLFVVEDMAQALDAEHKDKRSGSFGAAGCVSFFPTKNLGAAGDGGMIFCDDDGLADRIRRICRHGAQPKYHHVEVGGNFRLDPIQAAILEVKLEHLHRWNICRRDHAAFYDRALSDHPSITTPTISDDNLCVFNQYTIRVPHRDRLRDRLAKRGVGTNVYYPEPLHLQPALGHLGHSPGDFPNTEAACREVLSLPIFPELTDEELRRVVEALRAGL